MSSTPSKTKWTEVWKGEQRRNKREESIGEIENYRRGVSGEFLKMVWQCGLGQCDFCSLAALYFLNQTFGPGAEVISRDTA